MQQQLAPTRFIAFPARLVARSRMGTCPSCGCRGRFSYLGIQEWPPRLAQLHGGKTAVSLWNCDQCHTTISEDCLSE